MTIPTTRKGRGGRRCATDSGFSLIEAAIALFISVILFSMLGVFLAASFRQARTSRALEQATQLGVEGIEISRSFPWDELAMDGVESGDSRVAGGQLLASAADLEVDEDLVVDAALGSVQSKYSVLVDDQSFDVWQYVTDVETGELRRVVVVVTWSLGNAEREHHTSTLVSRARID